MTFLDGIVIVRSSKPARSVGATRGREAPHAMNNDQMTDIATAVALAVVAALTEAAPEAAPEAAEAPTKAAKAPKRGKAVNQRINRRVNAQMAAATKAAKAGEGAERVEALLVKAEALVPSEWNLTNRFAAKRVQLAKVVAA